MKNVARLILVALLGLLAALVIDCGCGDGSVCGSGNIVAPSNTSTITLPPPQASPSPSATPGCVAQPGAFVCSRGASVFEAILLDTQRSVLPAAEPIYVVNLVAALNLRADVCAIVGPSPDEVTIKARNSNALSATWDVVKADGTIHAIPTPLNVCIPARF